MNQRALSVLAGIALTVGAGAWAADAAPSAPAASDPARMERVLRDAANPMRMILEAAKLRPARTTVVVHQPAAAPASASARPAVAAAPAALVPSAAPTRSPPTAGTAEAVRPAVATSPAAEPAQASTPLGPAVEPPAPVVVSPAAAQPAGLPPVTPAVERAVASSLPAPSSPPPALARAAEQVAAPVLVDQPLVLAQMVEPSWTERLIRRLKPTSRVTVGMTVQPDGHVSDVAVRSSTDKALEPAVLEAVSQWRFQPVPRSRTHVVELVLNPPE